MKKYAFLIFVGILCLLLSGCQSSPFSDVQDQTEAPVIVTPAPIPTKNPKGTWKETLDYYRGAVEQEGLAVQFSAQDGFYSEDFLLTLTAEGDADIFYTDDGSEPGPRSTHYTRPISLAVTDAGLPRCAVIRAAAYYPDGTKSPVCTGIYFLNSQIKNRFDTLVFSIVGPPEELTYGPMSLLVGQRALDTSASAKRTVLLQVFETNGTEVLNQSAELRVYGGESRRMPVKSLQLTAETEESFVYPFFGGTDGKSEAVPSFGELILSNGEDDFQYAFIRDELAQTLAKQTGFSDAEDVRHAVVYINGEYYGLHWLHTASGGALQRGKYSPGEDRYIVVDWTEEGARALAAEDQGFAQAFQEEFARLMALDLTDDENYGQLCRFLDVDRYLDCCALNVFMDDQDFPARMRLYAWLPAGENTPASLWRLLLYDMDRTFGLSDGGVGAAFDTLGALLDPENARYAPLFASLMNREDCRARFVEKMNALLETGLDAETALSAFNALHQARSAEMKRYLTRLETLRKERNSPIWMKKSNYEKAVNALTEYIAQRPKAVREAMDMHFAETAEESEPLEDAGSPPLDGETGEDTV